MCFLNSIFTTLVWTAIIPSLKSLHQDRDGLVLTSDAIGLLILGGLKFSSKNRDLFFWGVCILEGESRKSENLASTKKLQLHSIQIGFLICILSCPSTRYTWAKLNP